MRSMNSFVIRCFLSSGTSAILFCSKTKVSPAQNTMLVKYMTILALLIKMCPLERFSFECRKVIGFALSTRCDWLKRFAPPFHPIRSKTKANCDALARFSRALRQPHVITSSYDWFVLSVCYVIGQSNYFGFGFTTLKRKPLYRCS